jgi:YYY domain-containing protein
MIDLIKWFFLFEILGWITFPITFKLFKGSADKGYSISKILGLLLWGYIYWLGNSFQILENSITGTVFALFLLIVGSIFFIRNISFPSLVNWCKQNIKIIAFFDALFLFAFISWAIIRAANPEIIGTEKPMELAFITSIFRSPSFPPSDPWLSDYAISYYYFGYLMVTMIMRICGTVSGVAFNLTISAWFALAAVVSSGILFNLLFFRRDWPKEKRLINRLLLFSLLAPLMILIVSNGEGLLEVLHSKGVFWRMDSNNQMTSSVWQWVGIKELTDPPPLPLDWMPGRVGSTWWWRASRVLQDYTLNGQSREIIDEFPFFSFLLADLHPHVLSMPFVLLVIYFGFSIFNQPGIPDLLNTKLRFYLKMPQVWLSGFILGGLIFINTWDFPIYFGLFVLIDLFQIIKAVGITNQVIKHVFSYSIALGIFSVLLYSPFLLGLSSQAGGFIPSLIFRTRGIHFIVMFLTQIFFISWFLIAINRESLFKKDFNSTILTGIFVSVLLLLFSVIFALLPVFASKFLDFIANLTKINMSTRQLNLNSAASGLLGIFGADNFSDLIQESLNRLINEPFVIFFLLLLFALCFVGIINRKHDYKNINIEEKKEIPIRFVQILIILGALLIFIPEFFYLRDQFGWRMNTIFKFYFQAWIIFSLAAAYSIVEIFSRSKTNLKMGISLLLVIIFMGTGLIYPFFALPDKTNSFRNIDWSLDGNNYFKNSNPLENEAITFLNTVPYGTVAEAVGGSYSNYGRISKISGLPSVLEWPGHESQWRGGATEIGNREFDLKDLFITSNWNHAKAILEKYEIHYVFIGFLEKSAYPISFNKFDENLEKIFNNSEVTIYEYSPKSR